MYQAMEFLENHWHYLSLKESSMKTKLNATIGAVITAAALSLGMVSAPAFAVKGTGGEYNTLYAGLGAKGYDVVAYFTNKKATKGSDKFVHEFGGVKWQFASQAHLDEFKKDPAKYTPQYGGFCAWGISVGKLFDVDPENGWHVTDGKLYLNFNADINKTFAGDVKGFVAKANGNWSNLNK
jgi:YHS domain-containing protein